MSSIQSKPTRCDRFAQFSGLNYSTRLNKTDTTFFPLHSNVRVAPRTKLEHFSYCFAMLVTVNSTLIDTLYPVCRLLYIFEIHMVALVRFAYNLHWNAVQNKRNSYRRRYGPRSNYGYNAKLICIQVPYWLLETKSFNDRNLHASMLLATFTFKYAPVRFQVLKMFQILWIKMKKSLVWCFEILRGFELNVSRC